MKARIALSLAALCAAFYASAQYVGSKPVPADLKAGFEAITISDAKNWLGYLAGPECEGRGAGQAGYQKAAEYMAARFKEMGVKPAGDDGTYFQWVRTSGTIADGSALSVGGYKVDIGAEFGFSGVRGGGEYKAPVVFLQAKGAAAGQAGPKVPAGVRGKVVIADLDSVNREFRSELLSSAKFVIEVSELIPETRTFSAFGLPSTIGQRGRITPKAYGELATNLKYAPKTGLAEGETALSLDMGEANVTVKVENLKRSDPNVVGILEGSDPVLKHETVGIGAHLDHLGNRNGVIYWGADDDGSGSTALLGIIKAMKANKVKPKRSILFMAFAGEESGLVGSRFLAEYPPVPLDKMICELQMDMVGRNSDGIQNGDRSRVDVASENVDTMRLVGSKRIATGLHNLIIEQNEHINFRFKYDSEDVYTRSDHYSFAAKGVPIAFQFDGFHPDYHQPTDTIDKINFEKLTNAAKLFYLVAMRAAQRPAPFVKDVPQTGDGN